MAAAKPKAVEVPSDGVTTNSAKNISQHGFSGDTCEVKLFRAEQGEPGQVFVGLNSYTATLHREKWLRIPMEVADHLESLTYSVMEPDPDFPDDRIKDRWVEKARFPLQRRD